LHSQNDGHSGDITGQPSDLHYASINREFIGQQSEVEVGNPQSEFYAIKDAVNKLKLPEDLRLNDSKRGIKRNDQATYQVLARSARFVETNFKLLSTLSPGEPLSQDEFQHLYKVQLAHMRFLQSEYASLVVQSKFDENTAQFFRAFQQNTSGLSEDALKDLKLASTLAASITVDTSNKPKGGQVPGRSAFDNNWRDQQRRGASSFRGGYNRGRGYQGYGQPANDVYNRYANRSVPPQRPSSYADG
jgi:hypothetical protein